MLEEYNLSVERGRPINQAASIFTIRCPIVPSILPLAVCFVKPPNPDFSVFTNIRATRPQFLLIQSIIHCEEFVSSLFNYTSSIRE